MLAAFYDFDGTLVSSNVVTRYFFFARNRPRPGSALRRSAATVLGLPYWLYLDGRSRLRFNEVFYRQYRGLRETWLREMSERLFEEEIKPKIYTGSQLLVDRDRSAGFKLVLVTGGLSFALEPAAHHFGFDAILANRMIFEDGRSTGELEPPILAEAGKLKAIHEFCRQYNVDVTQSKAYSDSFSDAPMLDCVGLPSAVNPDKRLRALALERNWPILSTKKKS